MANYVPWYGKKRARLAEHERIFLLLLQNETDMKQLREAADTVRLAQVRALKSKRAQFPPSEKYAAAIANLDRKIQAWLALTADEVIEGYRNGTLWKHRTKPSRMFTT